MVLLRPKHILAARSTVRTARTRSLGSCELRPASRDYGEASIAPRRLASYLDRSTAAFPKAL